MKNGSKKFYILGSIVTMILIVCVAVLIGILSIKPNKTEAAPDTHYEIVVDKVSTVTVYVTGSGVSLYESEEAGGDDHSDVIHDVYRVEKGTEVTIIAVNELKVFTSWNATDLTGNTYAAVDGSTDQQKTFVPEKDIRISANRRDTTSDDVGKYMGNRFLIEGAQDLFLLQKAFEIGSSATVDNATTPIYDDTDNTKDVTLINFYDKLFGNSAGWNLANSNADKVTTINSTHFKLLQTGYYLVNQNFAYLDKDNNMPFTGIGNSSTNAFNGVMCGLNENNISTISLTIQKEQTAGSLYFGLFGYLGDNAVIRNLNVQTSIGITNNSSATTNVYAGGLAGYSNGAFVYNVNALARHSIDITSSGTCNIYAGSLFGYMNGGIEEYANVVANGEDAAWIIKATSQTNIHTGLLAGYAANTYVNDLLAEVSGYAATVNNTSASTNVYMGNLFGKYEVTVNNANKKLHIRNIRVAGTRAENIATLIDNGNAYVSGLIGYVDSVSADSTNPTTQQILIGKINFQITNKDVTSKITATSLDSDSTANLYTAGLFARVSSKYLYADNDFKQGISKLTLEDETGVDKTYYRYDFIFNANYYIESINNGECSTDTGKVVSGGLVGQGLFNINGDSTNISNILISSEDYNLTIKATQTSTTKDSDSDKKNNDHVDHCIVGLVTALIDTASYDYTFSYINMYSNSTSIIATRELSSKAIGDISGGGFIGYSKNTKYSHINLYLNNSELRVEGLSYDAQGTAGNNVNAGGFIGRFEGASTTNNSTINYVQLAGFDYDKEFKDDGETPASLEDKVIGTTLKLTSIQNTIPGGDNYLGENYTGGMIGLMVFGSVSNSTYFGSVTDEDYIQMQCHQSPDSAFCGGFIGFIKEQTGSAAIEVTNCKVLNANVYGAATNTNSDYDNPDIYIGGIIGAIYCDAGGVVTNITSCSVEKSNIQGVANELIDIFTGGILGVMTWEGTCNIFDTYVYDSNIEANHNSLTDRNANNSSYTGGILGRSHYAYWYYSTTNIKYSAVMDTSVTATSRYGAARSGGIASYIYRGSVENCYSNAKIYANGADSSTKYGIGAREGNSYNPSNSFYVLQNATGATKGTALDFSNENINGTAVNLFGDVLTGDYKDIKKYYIVLHDDSIFAVNADMTMTHDNDTNTSNNADIYINIKEVGNATPPTSYSTIDELHAAGWFKLGTVLTYRGTAQSAGTINAPTITYPDGSAEYKFEDSKFKNLNYPYNYVENIGYTEGTLSTTIGNINFNNKYTIKVRDNIPQIKIAFKINSGESALTPVFYDASGNVIDITSEEGTYTFTNTASGSDTIYEFVFTPNTEITNDTVINIGFKIGSTNYLSSGFQLDIKANKRVIKYLTYAEYTPPINYKENENLGTSSNPYLIKQGSVTKLIPVFTRINDLPIDGKLPEYYSELNVDYVNYTITSGLGTMKTNGEFVAASSAQTGTITATLKADSTSSASVNVKLVTTYSVSYSVIGAEVSGLTYANGTTPYILEMNCLEHYGGIPKTFTVKINNTTYSTADVLANNWIKDANGNVVTEWDVEESYYKLEIPSSEVDKATTANGIVVTIEMQVVYTITFDLQCDTFNPNYKGNQKLVFKVLAGKEFNTFFTDAIVGATDSTDKETVNGFLNSAISTIDGYLCTGFFLVNEASSEISYGVSFNELKDTSIPINTSYTFYARWNFLIELVEAPGTSIVSRFKETFMLEINNSEYSDYVNRTIAVPINANKGYVFSVEKEAGFVGEADVKAYVISNKGSSTQTVSEISIEKYHENMYLYFIAPEKITGYLVIVTSVSNSEVIVGENTAQVTDEVLPEDGIYTFKYVVNHKNTVDENGNPVKSFIYDSGINNQKERNLDLVKDLYIQFFDQNYNKTSKKLELARKTLEPGTIIEVYYNLYINNSTTPTSASIGSYVVSGNSTSSLLLSDFKKINNDQDFITTPQTFREFLGSNEAVSEVYYFVVTPPNGYDKASNKDGYGNIDNDVVFVGYYDPAKKDELKNENYKEFDLYVQGKRTGKSFANKPIQDQQGNFEEFTNETSLQQKIYAMTPSRNTNLTLNSGTYKFEDYTQFNYIDIFMSNKAITNGIIKLEDKSTNNTIIKSGFVEYGINKLSLELGYSIGDVDIYGSYYDQGTASYKEEKVATINVDKIDYNKYEVEFGNKDKIYYYFRIDNVSLSEIRLKEIILTDQYYLREFNISADTYKEADMEDTFYKYVVKQSIVGDLRHESKQFMLALQFKNSSGTILDIDDSNPIVLNISYVDVNGNTVTATINSNLEASKGKMVVYFDLSKVLSTYNINEFTFTVGGLPTGYSVYCSQLIESSIIEKPAMGEVRVSIK